MSVAAANGAVSTPQHQPTAEQIRLAQLIDDKKHNQPEVQEIVRKVLDVVADCDQEDALVALFDCDYDCERAVALLIEKGHDVASEWRTATNHKVTKKQQQKLAANKNGNGEVNENGQTQAQQQRGNDTSTSRGQFRGGRSRPQQNGGESQHVNHQASQVQNESYNPQQRQRGGSGFPGRYRGNNRSNYRNTDRHQQAQQFTQDTNVDSSLPSDTNRRPRETPSTSTTTNRQQQEVFDVGNWNGETLIYSRTAKEDESEATNADKSSTVANGRSEGKSKPEFDREEATRQIKNVIGIGQTPKTSLADQHQQSKSIGQTVNSKVTPLPPPPQQQQQLPPRIPHQPVIFSDRFDGGTNKLDIQFGNLGDTYEDHPGASARYQQSEVISSNKMSHRSNEQASHISPATRSAEHPVMNQQRIHPTQLQQQQQPSMTMKPVVPPQYPLHQQHQQHQLNTQNILLQSLLFHHQQQQHHQTEPVTLDSSYDPTTFPLPSIDFNASYYMPAPMNQPPAQPTQPRYLVPQPPLPPQQNASKTAPAPSGSTSTSTSTAKKGPAVPPGIFPPNASPMTQPGFSPAYGVQPQTGGATYSTPYDAEHLFSSQFMPLANVQQAPSPSATYGSVTPPVQPQNQQQTNNTNENKTMNFRTPMTENLMLLQQYQQYALQQPNSQQQGQPPATHSTAPLGYYLGHPPSGPSYSPGPQIMYAPAATAMTQQQQQTSKQPSQQYNQNNSSTGLGGKEDYYGRNSSASNKEGQYMYASSTQPHHGPSAATGQQQSGVNKQQHQQRTSGNVYNHQHGQQRSFQ